MRLALFGATGRAGGAVLRQSRAAGYEIQALARSPGRLDRDDPCVAVTAGDVRDVREAPMIADARQGGRTSAAGEQSGLATAPAGQGRS